MLLRTFWEIVKRILRYVYGTMDLGVTLHASADTVLTAYSDADWAGYPDTRRSTLGYCVFLGTSLISLHHAPEFPTVVCWEKVTIADPRLAVKFSN